MYIRLLTYEQIKIIIFLITYTFYLFAHISEQQNMKSEYIY